MTNELTTIINQAGLAETQTQKLLNSFGNYFKNAQELANGAKSIVVDDESQTDLMTQARTQRLTLKNIRVEVEKTRKELKEQSLREGKAIDGISNVIKALIVPVEEHLEKQEKFAEIKEAERMNARFEMRIEKLSKYVDDVSLYQLKDMSEEVFNKLIADSKSAHEARVEAERKAEADRIAKEKAEREETERIRQENEKLRKEAEEREKKLATERAKQEAELAKERAEQLKKIEAERKARENAEAKLRADQEAKAKAEAERLEKIEADKKEAEEQEREKLLAPDKEKLLLLADQILKIQLPAVKSNEAQRVIRATEVMLEKTSNYIREHSKSL